MLRGIRVLEHGTYITGPACGMMLADIGAYVIKVEVPGTGDPFRSFDGGLYSPHFQTYNRNKHSIELDTRKPADHARFLRLIETADIYIQNFRPGVAEELGAGHADLLRVNPRLIYCAISGFGGSGPIADRPCYDTIAQAISGFLGLMINPQSPRVTGPALADAITGLMAAYSILAALHERELTGSGQLIELSMMEAMAYFNLDAFTHYFAHDEVMGPYSRPRVSQSYVLECSDGGWLALHMSSPKKFWQGLAEATKHAEILRDPRFCDRAGRIENQEALLSILKKIFRRRPRAEWLQVLGAHGVPSAPLYKPSEVADDPQARHLDLFVKYQHPLRGPSRSVRFPASFNGQRMESIEPPPMLGQDNEEILEREPSSPTRD